MCRCNKTTNLRCSTTPFFSIPDTHPATAVLAVNMRRRRMRHEVDVDATRQGVHHDGLDELYNSRSDGTKFFCLCRRQSRSQQLPASVVRDRERSAVRCTCKLRDGCSFLLLAARNADVYHALLAGAGLQQRPSAPAAATVSPAFASSTLCLLLVLSRVLLLCLSCLVLMAVVSRFAIDLRQWGRVFQVPKTRVAEIRSFTFRRT